MGLDLVLYTAFDAEGREEKEELAYGRKTWAIADFLRFDEDAIEVDGDWLYKIPKTTWDRFVNAIAPYMENHYFRVMVEDFYKYLWKEEDKEEEWDPSKECVYSLIESALDNMFGYDCSYQLGPDWEMAAVIRWWEAREKVNKAYEDNETVWLIVSY